MNLKLSDEDITALALRTEGWIAGLHLVSVALQGRQNVSQFVYAWALIHANQLETVEQYLQNAEIAIETGKVRGEVPSMRGEIAAIRARVVAFQGDSSRTIELSQDESANLYDVELVRSW